MTVSLLPRALPLDFPLHNQTVALAVSAALLWHVSCDIFSQLNMSHVVLSAKAKSESGNVTKALECAIIILIQGGKNGR